MAHLRGSKANFRGGGGCPPPLKKKTTLLVNSTSSEWINLLISD